MLYRALAYSAAFEIGRFPENSSGLFHTFIELEEGTSISPFDALRDRFAAHFGVPRESVFVFDWQNEEELVTNAAGPAHPVAWRWFEYGVMGNGQPSYISAWQLLILMDDARTTDMMLETHTALMRYQAHLAADVAYDDQVQQDLQMDGLWYGLTGDPEIDQAVRPVDAQRDLGLVPLPMYRSHVRIGSLCHRVKPLPGAVINRVRQRQARAEENRRVAQARMVLPPLPLGGRNARTFRARLAWELEREQVVFAATFGLAMAEQAGKVAP